MKFNWKKMVGTVAPTLATALGGPLAGMAVDSVAKALGVSETSNAENEISEILTSPNPEILLKLKEADQNFQTQLKQLDIDLEKIAVEDRQSARNMRQVMKDRFPDLLAVVVTIGFFSVLAVHLFCQIPEGNKTFLNIMLGALAGVWLDCMRFYFGSSSGSKNKDNILAQGIVKQNG